MGGKLPNFGLTEMKKLNDERIKNSISNSF